MGKASRDKGKRGERELAALLREHGFSAERGFSQCRGGDVSADVIGLPGWHCEVKRYAAPQCVKWYEQAERDAQHGNEPIVFTRGDRGKWLAVVDATWVLGVLLRTTQAIAPSPSPALTQQCSSCDSDSQRAKGRRVRAASSKGTAPL